MSQQIVLGTQQTFGIPNTGLGIEEGDTWNAAVTKINSNFSELYAATGIGTQRTVIGSTTLDASYNGQTILYNGTDDALLTFPPNLSPSFSCAMVQLGAGAIRPIAGSGVSINNRLGFTQTAGQLAVIGVFAVAFNTFVLSGDGAA